LRLQIGEALGANRQDAVEIPVDQQDFRWSSWSEGQTRLGSARASFPGIVDDDLEKLETAPWEVRSKG